VRTEHGEAPGGRRQLPVLVKDVAGLVPGAYMGRGRGNAFLNDLCDADSLIHVVDASGRSDSEGVDQGAGAAKEAADPLEEVTWVRREIHLWIFCNVRAKWDSVRKKARMATTHAAREALADRLFSLFTGYHATKPLVTQVYEAAGYSLAGMAESVYSWSEYELHLMVACFLRARFPIVVALNKADLPEAAPRVARVKEVLASACLPISARSEWWLWDTQRQGHLTYQAGGDASSVALASGAPAAVATHWKSVIRPVLEQYGSTGAQDVVSSAVQRRRPLFVCPVADFETLDALQAPATGSSISSEATSRGNTASAAASGGGPRFAPASRSPLATMVLLRPLSTVEEAFAALKHEQLLRGDFVRAELLADLAKRSVRVLKRDDVLSASGGQGAIVLKMLTNKKAK